MSCGHTLSWYELFPFFSYIILRGRCKKCGGRIPFRLLCMEVLTALLFVFVYSNSDTLFFLAFGLIISSLLIVIASYDMQHMVIPNELIITVICLATLYVGYEAYTAHSFSVLVTHGLSALSATLFYGFLWIISKGTWIGLGDVKFVFPLALMLSATQVFSFIALSFWIGAIISVLLLSIQKISQRGKRYLLFFQTPLTMRSEVPFAPFMIAGFILVFFQQINVLTIMTQFF
jgi:prepilin signal peptidase PulO-like enzyme (type II secretory pathway)